MTALLELKQKIKEIYGQYEMYILPVMKFVLALVYFLWINANMGYMSRLNNVFLVLILALIKTKNTLIPTTPPINTSAYGIT